MTDLRRRWAVALAVVLLAASVTGAQTVPARDAARFFGMAYFGTYSVDEQARTITHHRKGSINPGQVGDDVVRAYVFESNDRLVLTPAGSTNKIVWERAR